MALALEYSSLSPEAAKLIGIECVLKPNKSQFNDDPKAITFFDIVESEDRIYIPLGCWRLFLDSPPDYEYPLSTFKFDIPLYTLESDPKGYRDQDVVFREAIAHLEKESSVFLALPTGFGKTTMAIALSAHFGLKTIVLSHIDEVNKQWFEEYEKMGAKVQKIRDTQKIDPEADVYICGVRKANNFLRSMVEHIGMIIIDEAHVSTITAFSKSLLKFQPKYIIGLSATPKRVDGMHSVLKMYFGDPKKFISRHEVKDFVVYKLETDFKPKVKYLMMQNDVILDWSTIISSLSANEDRQALITNLVLQHPEHRIMILSDRKDQCIGIHQKLLDSGETNIQLLIGTSKPKTKKKQLTVAEIKDILTKAEIPFKKSSKRQELLDLLPLELSSYTEDTVTPPRVIIAGMKKAGIGFNDPTLTMLIIATDCKNVQQYEGRIRTLNNVIYDLVDCFSTLENHWKLREKWYIQRGAEIKVIKRKELLEVKKGKFARTSPAKRLLKPNK